MNWYLVLMVFALVLSILQAFLIYATPARPLPHLGWLAFACFVAAHLIGGRT
jgi:hypothetical protein